MLFDFEKFETLARAVYKGGYRGYSFGDCMAVFRCYFAEYEMHTGYEHPPIRLEQIARIMEIMAFEGPAGEGEGIDPAEYPEIIRRHFLTDYRRCDYNINHFFAGRIRALRRQEVDRGL